MHAGSPMTGDGGLPLHRGAKSGWQRSSKATLQFDVSFVEPLQSAFDAAQWRAHITLSLDHSDDWKCGEMSSKGSSMQSMQAISWCLLVGRCHHVMVTCL